MNPGTTGPTAAYDIVLNDADGIDVMGGSLVLPPGTLVAFYTTTACTAAFLFHFLWEEIPV